MIILASAFGNRYCQDGRIRSFANFGDGPGCVKTYKSLGWALRVARCYKLRVIMIPKGWSMDACGVITDGNDVRHSMGELVYNMDETPYQYKQRVLGRV